MTRHDPLTLCLLLGFCALSAVTSGVGLHQVFDRNIDLAAGPWLGIGLAGAGTLGLQALIVRFWSWAGVRRWSRSRRVLALAVALGASMTSGGLAAGCYIYAFNKTAIEEYRTRQNTNQVIEPLAVFGKSLLDIALSVETIAAKADNKKEIEIARGGTCQGDVNPRPTCGPKCRLRERHAGEAIQLAKTARKMSNEANGIISGLQQARSRESIIEAFQEAHGVATAPARANIGIWLEAEIEGFKTSFFDDESESWFVCRDPQLEREMEAVLLKIKEEPALPNVPPDPVEVSTIDTIAKSYKDSLELSMGLVTGRLSQERREALAYSYPGFVVAGFVEAVIVLLVLFGSFRERDRGLEWEEVDEFTRYMRELSPSDQQRYRRWLDLMLALLIEDRRCVYFAQPLDGSPEVGRECNELVRILGLPLDPDLGPDVPLAELYPEWVMSRNGVHGGARSFTLRPLNREMLVWLRKIARDLSERPVVPDRLLRVVGAVDN